MVSKLVVEDSLPITTSSPALNGYPGFQSQAWFLFHKWEQVVTPKECTIYLILVLTKFIGPGRIHFLRKPWVTLVILLHRSWPPIQLFSLHSPTFLSTSLEVLISSLDLLLRMFFQ